MYRERGGCGSKVEIGAVDRKRINDALDKHLEKSSPSTSRFLNGKEKDRLSVLSTSSGKQPEHRLINNNFLLGNFDSDVPCIGVFQWVRWRDEGRYAGV
ncbi:hypothetical protein BHE74_00023627 [Ensete ventricosum]|nr:hypothetical protein GW17_00012023 [Ensete ventricosum]RWW68819.1 hypothetical protein BHE74_00023627 [Ensete ventricosum]RZR89034.1 hypothetical protein BHM03_00016702 [Ensete ventricosum]